MKTDLNVYVFQYHGELIEVKAYDYSDAISELDHYPKDELDYQYNCPENELSEYTYVASDGTEFVVHACSKKYADEKAWL